MSDQEVQTGEVYKAEKVLDVVFPSGDKSAEVVHPRKEPLHSPAPGLENALFTVLTLALGEADNGHGEKARSR